MSTSSRVREVIGDLPIDAFAELLDEKPQRIKDVLRERQKIPVDMLEKLVERLDVDLNWLIACVGTQRSTLSPRETLLLNNYRSAQPAGRSLIEQTAALAAQPQGARVRK